MYFCLVFLLLITAVASKPAKIQADANADSYLTECVASNDPWYDERFCVWALGVKWPKKIRDLPLMRCCVLRQMRDKAESDLLEIALEKPKY